MRRFRKALQIGTLLLLLMFAGAPANAGAVSDSFVGQDLSAYYPGAGLNGMYLTGANYVSSPPSSAVLWDQAQDSMTFLQHNWSPSDSKAACHTDQLSWWPDGYLRYVKTTDACGPDTTVIDYGTKGNPIIFLPRVWNGKPWQLSGSSPAVYRINGQVQCTGTDSWVAKILGVDQVAPGEFGLHWQTRQTTTWATGGVPGGCWAGTVTNWQEDYWLVNDLPSPSGPMKGLKRSKGGNLSGADNWDVWMDRWAPLP
jgi:hypothetical protein